MPGKVFVSGTLHSIRFGTFCNNGTVYDITKGETMVSGTIREISIPPRIRAIPEGRVIGDVDGNGYVEQYDAQLALQAAMGEIELDEMQFKCADTNSDGLVDMYDAQILSQAASESIKLGSFSKDILGNWSINENFETEEAQFFTVVNDAIPDGATISFDGEEANKIKKYNIDNGKLCVYMTVPPISPVFYTVL